MAQIISITSEALQATVRRLLPSQQGFGEDLQASNVVQPIIDLTPTAEGSSVPQILQTAINLGGLNRIFVQNGTTSLVTGGGFYRCQGNISIETDASVELGCGFKITDGFSTQTAYDLRLTNRTADFFTAVPYDIVVFLRPSDVLQGFSDDTEAILSGSFRQIADSGGVLINPIGFTPQ